MDAESLDQIVKRSLAPLEREVGSDLAAQSPEELSPIRNQFSQSARDFPLLLDLGERILTEHSKDLWALWAVVGGILWSQKFENSQALAASCKLSCELCKRYWRKIYPASLGLRNTLLANVVKWWNTFLAQHGPGLDRRVLRECAEQIRDLERFLIAQVGEDEEDAKRKFPMLPMLGFASRGMITLASRPPAVVESATTERKSPPTRSAEQGDDWWGADSMAEFDIDEDGEPADDPVEPASASSVPAAPLSAEESPGTPESLDRVFSKAVIAVQSGDLGSIQEFERRLQRAESFAERFRAHVMLGELYLRAGQPQRSRKILEYAHRQLQHIRLSDWDPALCGRLWTVLMRSLAGGSSDAEALHAELALELSRLDRKAIPHNQRSAEQ